MIKSKRGMSGWIWILIILILIVVGVGIYYLVTGNLSGGGSSGIPTPPPLPD